MTRYTYQIQIDIDDETYEATAYSGLYTAPATVYVTSEAGEHGTPVRGSIEDACQGVAAMIAAEIRQDHCGLEGEKK